MWDAQHRNNTRTHADRSTKTMQKPERTKTKTSLTFIQNINAVRRVRARVSEKASEKMPHPSKTAHQFNPWFVVRLHSLLLILLWNSFRAMTFYRKYLYKLAVHWYFHALKQNAQKTRRKKSTDCRAVGLATCMGEACEKKTLKNEDPYQTRRKSDQNQKKNIWNNIFEEEIDFKSLKIRKKIHSNPKRYKKLQHDQKNHKREFGRV